MQAFVQGVVLNWCLVQTEPRAESTASHWLNRLGLEVFLPQYQRERYSRRNSRKKEIVSAPLYPRYLFVRGIVRKTEIENQIGVSRLFVDGEHNPQSVPDSVISHIRLRIDPETGLIPVDKDGEPATYRKGQTLRVIEGPYQDLRGLFLRSEGERVRVLLRFMGGNVEHLIPERCVEAIAA